MEWRGAAAASSRGPAGGVGVRGARSPASGCGWGGVEVRSQGSGEGRRAVPPFSLGGLVMLPEKSPQGLGGGSQGSGAMVGEGASLGEAAGGQGAAVAAPAWGDHVKTSCRSWETQDTQCGGPFGAHWLRSTQHCLASGWRMSPADPDAASLCLRGPGRWGPPPRAPEVQLNSPRGWTWMA